MSKIYWKSDLQSEDFNINFSDRKTVLSLRKVNTSKNKDKFIKFLLWTPFQIDMIKNEE